MMDEKELDIIHIGINHFPNTIKIEGLDCAVVGLSIRKPNLTNYIYSVNKIIKHFMEQGETYDKAVELYESTLKPLENIDEKHSPMFFDDRPHFTLN